MLSDQANKDVKGDLDNFINGRIFLINAEKTFNNPMLVDKVLDKEVKWTQFAWQVAVFLTNLCTPCGIP